MSKLSDSIVAKQCNERAYPFLPLTKISAYQDVTPFGPNGQAGVLYQHMIKAEFGANVWSRLEDKERQLQSMRASVVEAVFGEFREDFLNMRIALYDRDLDKLEQIMNDFQIKMFKVD